MRKLRKGKWEFYKDNKEQWRWRHIAPNGRIIGASTQGYKNRYNCNANAIAHGYVIDKRTLIKKRILVRKSGRVRSSETYKAFTVPKPPKEKKEIDTNKGKKK